MQDTWSPANHAESIRLQKNDWIGMGTRQRTCPSEHLGQQEPRVGKKSDILVPTLDYYLRSARGFHISRRLLYT